MRNKSEIRFSKYIEYSKFAKITAVIPSKFYLLIYEIMKDIKAEEKKEEKVAPAGTHTQEKKDQK
jgi:hypothetical protein